MAHVFLSGGREVQRPKRAKAGRASRGHHEDLGAAMTSPGSLYSGVFLEVSDVSALALASESLIDGFYAKGRQMTRLSLVIVVTLLK